MTRDSGATSIEISIVHRGGSRMDGVYIGHEASKGVIDLGLSGTRDFWLFTEGKHTAGHLLCPLLVWWKVMESDLKLVRGDHQTLRNFRRSRRKQGSAE